MRQRVVDSKWRATTSLVNKKSSHAIFLRLRFFAPRYTNDGRFALLSYDNEIPNLPKKSQKLAKNGSKMAQNDPILPSLPYCSTKVCETGCHNSTVFSINIVCIYNRNSIYYIATVKHTTYKKLRFL